MPLQSCSDAGRPQDSETCWSTMYPVQNTHNCQYPRSASRIFHELCRCMFNCRMRLQQVRIALYAAAGMSA